MVILRIALPRPLLLLDQIVNIGSCRRTPPTALFVKCRQVFRGVGVAMRITLTDSPKYFMGGDELRENVTSIHYILLKQKWARDDATS